MSKTEAYYERYWTDPDAAPPAQDPTTGDRKQLLAEALRGLPGRAVLDVGCGMGIFTEFLAKEGFEPVGMDLSEKAIAVAQKRVPQASYLIGTIEQHAEALRGRFHAVWCSEVIEHIFDIYGFLAAINECLAPSGRLVITTPYHGLLKNLLISLRGYAHHYNPFGGHIRFFDKTSLGMCLRHCGFRVVRWAGIGRTWPLYRSFFVTAEKIGQPLPPPPAEG